MDCREVQATLVALGYSIVVDGKPGPKTKAAIQAFQVSHGLHVDGIVGPKTIAALNAATAGKPQGASVFDRAKFFAYLRSGKAPMFGTSLSPGQVRGIEGILDGFAKTGDGRDKTLGYGLATARREVGPGMVPVREGFCKTDAAARAYVAKHYPNKGYSKPFGPWGHVYYGRGIVQLTWFDNYDREGIADDPDRALDPEFAAELMFAGLVDGRWNGQGKGIAFYLPTGGPDDLKNARRTVNVTDHWEEIASFYRQFMAAIFAAKGAA
ncbi:peptidoglycan-binding protein [Bosea sp. RCC_152_1]|uniref:peptidoglycan-binding protein n=1 Tax=Bosea sp. RCC_152_1 TaxID=3239228 RepID=UPI0035252C93